MLLTEAIKDIVAAKDFSKSAFDITMTRCQQLALESADKSVPDPSNLNCLLRVDNGANVGDLRLSGNIYCIRLCVS